MIETILLFLFTFVEYNVENLFDTVHDAGKQDEEFLPESPHHWTRHRYWQKLDHISQALVSCGDTSGGHLPDMAVLTEVENDSVMHDLTRRSPLRTARYEYVMTSSPDNRGIDVALIYSPFSFRLLNHHGVRITLPAGHRPTRDILYASGLLISGDTLHIIGVHAPSRAGGESQTRPYRMLVAGRVCSIVDSIRSVSSRPLILIAGDFNDYSQDSSIKLITDRGMAEAIIGSDSFVEIYLNTPLEICEARDPKKLYSKARQGLITHFTGISAPYEAPLDADICINTAQLSPIVAAQLILLKTKLNMQFGKGS